MIGVLATIIHEIGHILAIVLKKHKIKEIYIGFFYIDIVDKNRKILDYSSDLFILISGSLLNFIIAIISLVVYLFIKNDIMQIFIYTNIAVGIMNLLPISSLDGGQIIYIILSRLFSVRVSKILSLIISIIFLLPLSVIGFTMVLKLKYNFSLLFICCYLIYTLLWKNENNYL